MMIIALLFWIIMLLYFNNSTVQYINITLVVIMRHRDLYTGVENNKLRGPKNIDIFDALLYIDTFCFKYMSIFIL